MEHMRVSMYVILLAKYNHIYTNQTSKTASNIWFQHKHSLQLLHIGIDTSI